MTTPDTPGTAPTTNVRTMRAAVHVRFGDPRDAIEVVADVAVPTLVDDEVLVAVDAAGIAIGDWLTITGKPYVARPMYGIRAPKEPIAGLEMAGTVVAVGSAVTRFAVGDEVFGAASGSLAEYVAVAEGALVSRPSTITAEQAAAVPASASAALQGVMAGGATEGQKVLVVGASGAVGTFAVQIAKALGAEVTGVGSTRNLDMLRSIGADHVIDYTQEELTARGGDYDVILNIAGNNTIKDLRAALAPRGTLVMIGGSGGNWTMGFGRTLAAVAMNLFVRQHITSILSKPDRETLETLAGMLEAGEIVPVIDRTYPLEQTVDALEYLEARHTSGKSIVTI
jgi:NADPH:quinone reductase-like Zn-dependent oxidoreductase